jgi:hypothetical protein
VQALPPGSTPWLAWSEADVGDEEDGGDRCPQHHGQKSNRETQVLTGVLRIRVFLMQKGENSLFVFNFLLKLVHNRATA